MDGTAPGAAPFPPQLDLASVPVCRAGTRKITYTSAARQNPRASVCRVERSKRSRDSLAGATRELDIEQHLCVLPLATLLENVAGLYAPLLAGATCLVPAAGATGMSYAGLDAASCSGHAARRSPTA